VPTYGRKDKDSTTEDDEAASEPSHQDAAPLAALSADTAEVAAPLNPGPNMPLQSPSLKPPANLLGLTILEKAKSALEPGERAVMDKYAALKDPARAFDEAYTAAKTRQEEYKNKGAWTIKGHKIEWRAGAQYRQVFGQVQGCWRCFGWAGSSACGDSVGSSEDFA
jgi:hypothetical protein